MGWDGSGNVVRDTGVFQGNTAWQQTRDAGRRIRADDHDTHDEDLATAIENTVTRDGQNQPTTNLPMGGNRHTNCGEGQALSDYSTLGQNQKSTSHLCTVSGTGDAIVLTCDIAPSAYVTGQKFVFISIAGNTGPTTANVNNLGAITIKKRGGDDLEAGDIVTSEIVIIYYDGGSFQLSTLSTQGLTKTGDQTVTSTDPGADPGPLFTLDRAKQGAEVNNSDLLGQWVFKGRTFPGAEVDYAKINAAITDRSSGNTGGQIDFRLLRAAAETLVAYLRDGLVVGSPTGGDQGSGSINCQSLFVSGVPVLTENKPLFTSAGQDYSNSMTFTFAHGLSFRPNLYRAFIRAKTANNGYPIGAEIPLDTLVGVEDTQNNQQTFYGNLFVDNDTDIKVQTGGQAPYISAVPSGNATRISGTQWEIFVKVFS